MKIVRLVSVILALWAITSITPVAAQQGADNEPIEEIEVVGIRGSIRRAEAIKRDAKNVVEAITTEDFGKFSDDSLADSLRRVPGVQVEEDLVGSAGDKVSMRGLGPQFVIATVNGRTAWSSGNGEGRELRSYNFSVIPSEVVHEVLVTKTPVADSVEAGIGGAIDVRTLRPLEASFDDGANWIGRLDMRAEMVDIRDESWGPRLSGAIVGKNDAGTIGGYLGFNYSEVEGGRDRQQVRWQTRRDFFVDNNNNWIADPEEEVEEGTYPRDILYGPESYEQERGAITAALQFNPSDELSFVADVLYTETNRINRRPNTRFDVERDIRGNLLAPDAIVFEDGGLGDFPSHATFIDTAGIRCIDNGNQVSGAACDLDGRIVTMRDQYRNNFRDSLLTGLNVQFDRGALHINGDIFYNDLDTVVMEASIDAENNNTGEPLVADVRGDGAFNSGPNESDLAASNYEARRARIRQRANEGDQVGARVDFEFDIDNGSALESMQFGLRYNDSEFSYLKSQRPYWGQQIRGDADFNAAMQTENFFDPVNGVALPTFDLVAASEFLSSQGIAGEFDPGFGPCVVGDISESLNTTSRFHANLTDTCLDLRDSFTITEETISAYFALNFSGQWGNVPVSGNFGLRYVSTENESQGAVTIEFDGDDEIDPDPNNIVTTTGEFSELLPNLNVRFDLSDSVQIRFAAAESLSRPDLYQIVPRFNISGDDEDGSGDFTPEDCDGGGCLIKRGNPNLDPYTAWNYDVTLMWDTPTDAFIALSLFYKDIDGFIFEGISGPVTVPGFDDAQFFVQQPTNSSQAEVKGFEIAVHQPFTFLPTPFDGFGVQLNYSYTDSEFSADVDTSDIGTSYGLPGASKNNLNAILYYENDRFDARLAYVYRDDYFSTFGGGPDGLDRYVAANERLSLAMSYNITERIEIRAQGTNLTQDDRREFVRWETAGMQWYSQPRSYSIGVRVDF